MTSPIEYEDITLKDHGEQTIKCSDCNKPLMHYRVYTDGPVSHTLQASCPFCNGKSFQHKTIGLFYYGPIGQDEKGLSRTVVIDMIETEKGVTFFNIGKR